MRIGFGIVLYDKIEETKILADIIKNFSKDYYVLVCTNCKNSLKNLDYPNIDEVVFSEDLPFDRNKWIFDRSDINLNMRIVRNIQFCNQKLINNNELDYCVFLHSDSWVLSKEKLLRLISELEERKKYFAVTGVGLGLMTSSTPMGNILDMLWVYKRKEIKKYRLFEFDVMEMFPHKFDTHGIFSNNLIIKLGLSKILYYDNTGDSYFWKNNYLTESNYKYRYTTNATPALYLPKYDFIHVHVAAFRDNMGEQLQAYYLRKFKLKGPTINDFLKKYSYSDELVFSKIKEYDDEIKKRLHRNGLSYELLRWGKNYRKIEQFLNYSILKKYKIILNSWILKLIEITYTRERFYETFYGAKLNKNLNEFYNDLIKHKDIYDKYGHSKWYLDKEFK